MHACHLDHISDPLIPSTIPSTIFQKPQPAKLQVPHHYLRGGRQFFTTAANDLFKRVNLGNGLDVGNRALVAALNHPRLSVINRSWCYSVKDRLGGVENTVFRLEREYQHALPPENQDRTLPSQREWPRRQQKIPKASVCSVRKLRMVMILVNGMLVTQFQYCERKRTRIGLTECLGLS